MNEQRRDIQDFIEKMKRFQEMMLKFIDTEANPEAEYDNLIRFFEEQQVQSDQSILKSILQILIKISSNLHRGLNFFGKIEQIIKYFENTIKSYFDNINIYRIFKGNKRILLFLINENILEVDKQVANCIAHKNHSYPSYFAKEIRPFVSADFYQRISRGLPPDYEEKRNIGENDSYICQLIRNDSIDEFIECMNQDTMVDKSIQVNGSYLIKDSIFETNSYLLKGNITLIEYAAFFGSINIFNYLRQIQGYDQLNLFTFAVLSRKSELIDILKKDDISYMKHYFINAIMFHYNDIANQLKERYFNDDQKLMKYVNSIAIKYHNYFFISNDFSDQYSLFDLCKHGHHNIVKILLRDNNININAIKI